MFRVVPENLLHTSLCSNCGKYLSVLPVTVLPNLKIICGRCVDVGHGVRSNYDKLAEKMLFKCVNRYEGCSRLLLPSEVSQHEEECSSKNYECALCTNMWIPSYRMIQHFKEHHNNAVIYKPEFKIDTQLDTRKTFIYYTDRHIFFIRVAVDFDNKLTLGASCLGPDKTINKLKYCFCLTKGDQIRTSFQEFHASEQEISLLDGKSLVNCSFIVDYDLEKALDIVQIEPKLLQKNKLASGDIVTERRSIFVNEEFFIKNNDWKLSPCKTLLVHKHNPNFILYSSCSHCGFLLFGDIYRCSCSKKHLICDRCNSIINLCPGNGEFSNVLKTVEITYGMLKFYCKWKCHKAFVAHKLYTHEMDCKLRDPLMCLVCYTSEIPNVTTLKEHCSLHKSSFFRIYYLKNNLINLKQDKDNKIYGYFGLFGVEGIIGSRENGVVYFYLDDLKEYVIANFKYDYNRSYSCTLDKTHMTKTRFNLIVRIENRIMTESFVLKPDEVLLILIVKEA